MEVEMTMMFTLGSFARRLRQARTGQDLIEYALATGFVAVAALAFFPSGIAPSINTIMGRASQYLVQAAGS
jgi:hypothetical protein